MAECKPGSMRPVLIAAGGTGGHVFPALAVAERLAAMGIDVLWVGTKGGIEAKLVPAAGIELLEIRVGGFRGKNLWRRLLAPLQLLVASLAVVRLALGRKVACVFATGGYVSAASGIVAVLLRRPLFLQEQNAVAGTTNRMLARFADKVFTAYPGLFAGNDKVVRIGNPLRAAFDDIPSPVQRGVAGGETLRILVLGGSLGAQRLNEVVPGALAALDRQASEFSALRVCHQTGAVQRDAVAKRYGQLGLTAEVCAFIDDIPAVLQACDLVIARAGALTVSEICAAGVAAIFVPYPHAIDDHQSANARWLADCGAALVLPQQQLSEQSLGKLLDTLACDRDRLLAMAKRAFEQAPRDAAQNIAASLAATCEAGVRTDG